MTMPRRPKAQVWIRKQVRVTPEMAEEILSRGRNCAWGGCTNSCQGDLPPDWINILTWWWPQPTMRTVEEIVMGPTCSRDAVLCGQHARELESLLEPLGPDPRLDKPVGEG
jgi:hypothetical protein